MTGVPMRRQDTDTHGGRDGHVRTQPAASQGERTQEKPPTWQRTRQALLEADPPEVCEEDRPRVISSKPWQRNRGTPLCVREKLSERALSCYPPPAESAVGACSPDAPASTAQRAAGSGLAGVDGRGGGRGGGSRGCRPRPGGASFPGRWGDPVLLDSRLSVTGRNSTF